MSARKRKPFGRILAPQNESEAARLLGQIKAAQESVEDLRRDSADEMAEIKTRTESETAPHRAFISEASRALLAFAEENRRELTGNGKRRTIHLPTGRLGWRTTPPSIRFAKDTGAMLASLMRLGLGRFIRTIQEPDREAMLQEPEIAQTVAGVSISQTETFVVKPEGGSEVVIRLHKRRKR